MLYNDAYIPPVWRLKPGDTLTVALHNRLQQPTNLHFHGLHVSPRGNSDNVFFVFHCHVTKHEDKGMMQIVDVEEPGSAEASSGARP